MSKLIEFLQQYNTVEEKIEQLKNQFGITASHDPIHPDIYSINYSQIDSPKTDPVVRESRSIIVNLTNNEIVARTFDRFYNYGEAQNVVDIDLSNAIAAEKIDGSIFMFYYYNGVWYPASRTTTTARNTMMSVDNKPLPMLEIVRDFYDIEHIWEVEEKDTLKGAWVTSSNYNSFIEKLQPIFKDIDQQYTYVVELVSPYNMVVSKHTECGIYFLGRTDKQGSTNQELDNSTTQFKFPTTTTVQSLEEVHEFIKTIQSKNDYFVEGVVVTDMNGNKAKIKTKAYVAAHLASGGEPTHNSIVKVVGSYEEDEYLTYFPQHREMLAPYIEKRNLIIESVSTGLDVAIKMRDEGKSNKEISAALKKDYANGMPFIMKALNTGDIDIKSGAIERFLK